MRLPDLGLPFPKGFPYIKLSPSHNWGEETGEGSFCEDGYVNPAKRVPIALLGLSTTSDLRRRSTYLANPYRMEKYETDELESTLIHKELARRTG